MKLAHGLMSCKVHEAASCRVAVPLAAQSQHQLWPVSEGAHGQVGPLKHGTAFSTSPHPPQHLASGDS